MESYFHCVVEWHENSSVFSFLRKNEAAVQFLSAAYLQPLPLQQNSMCESVLSTSAFGVPVHSICCHIHSVLSDQEIHLLRRPQSVLSWVSHFSFSDSSSHPTAHSRSQHTESREEYAVLQNLISRCHSPSCIAASGWLCKLFLPPNSLSCFESPLLRACCSALLVRENVISDVSDGALKQKERYTLPAAISPRIVSEKAQRIHLGLGDVAHSIQKMSSAPHKNTSGWTLAKSSLPTRTTGVFFAPLSGFLDASILENSNPSAFMQASTEVGQLGALLSHLLALHGFEYVTAPRTSPSSEENTLLHFFQHRFHCTYCGAHLNADQEKKLPHSSDALGNAEQDGKAAVDPGRENDVVNPSSSSTHIVITCSWGKGKNPHCECCPWNKGFLTSVLQSSDAASSNYEEVTFSLAMDNAVPSEESDVPTLEENTAPSSAAGDEALSVTFRFLFKELGLVLSAWRLKSRLPENCFIQTPGGVHPLFNLVEQLDASKCISALTVPETSRITSSEVESFLNSLSLDNASLRTLHCEKRDEDGYETVENVSKLMWDVSQKVLSATVSEGAVKLLEEELASLQESEKEFLMAGRRLIESDPTSENYAGETSAVEEHWKQLESRYHHPSNEAQNRIDGVVNDFYSAMHHLAASVAGLSPVRRILEANISPDELPLLHLGRSMKRRREDISGTKEGFSAKTCISTIENEIARYREEQGKSRIKVPPAPPPAAKRSAPSPKIHPNPRQHYSSRVGNENAFPPSHDLQQHHPVLQPQHLDPFYAPQHFPQDAMPVGAPSPAPNMPPPHRRTSILGPLPNSVNQGMPPNTPMNRGGGRGGRRDRNQRGGNNRGMNRRGRGGGG